MDIKIKNRDGVKLLTAEKYCEEDINILFDESLLTTDVEDGILKNSLTGTYTNNRITSLKDYALYKSKISSFNSTSLQILGAQCLAYAPIVECNIPNVTQATSGASFYNCTKLKKLYLPNINSTFGNNCHGCTALTYVYFEKVPTITNQCFNNCSSLVAVIINKSTLCTLGHTNVFNNTPIAKGTGFVYVPDSLVDSYKSATNWSTYASQIKPLEEIPQEIKEELGL